MADKWISRFDWRYSSEEMTPATDTTATLAPAGFSLFNGVGSGKIVKLLRVTLNDRTHQDMNTAVTSTAVRVWVAVQANAPTITFDRIVPIKMNSDAPDLPAHVQCGRLNQFSTSVPTLSQADPDSVRKFLLRPGLRADGTNAIFNRGLANLHSSIFNMVSTAGGQRIRINAGQCVTMWLHHGENSWCLPKVWGVSATVLVDGETYVFRGPVQWGDDWHLSYVCCNWTLGNATGSAVVVEIVDIDVLEYTPDYDGSTYSAPKLALEPLTDLDGGTDLTTRGATSSDGATTPFDTAQDALPAEVRACLGGMRTQTGILPFRTYYHPSLNSGTSASPVPDPGRPRIRFHGGQGVDRSRAPVMFSGEYVMREGEGITLVQRENMSGVGNWDVEALWSIENDPDAGVSGYSRARGGVSRSRVVNQRRAANQ